MRNSAGEEENETHQNTELSVDGMFLIPQSNARFSLAMEEDGDERSHLFLCEPGKRRLNHKGSSSETKTERTERSFFFRCLESSAFVSSQHVFVTLDLTISTSLTTTTTFSF